MDNRKKRVDRLCDKRQAKKMRRLADKAAIAIHLWYSVAFELDPDPRYANKTIILGKKLRGKELQAEFFASYNDDLGCGDGDRYRGAER